MYIYIHIKRHSNLIPISLLIQIPRRRYNDCWASLFPFKTANNWPMFLPITKSDQITSGIYIAYIHVYIFRNICSMSINRTLVRTNLQLIHWWLFPILQVHPGPNFPSDAGTSAPSAPSLTPCSWRRACPAPAETMPGGSQCHPFRNGAGCTQTALEHPGLYT